MRYAPPKEIQSERKNIMNTYTMRLRYLGRDILKSIVLGTAIVSPIMFILGWYKVKSVQNFFTNLVVALIFGLIAGCIIAVFRCRKSEWCPSIVTLGMNLGLRILGGVAALVSGNPFIMVLVCVPLFLAAVFFAMVVLFSAISLPLTIVYYGIMALLEKKGRVPEGNVTNLLDYAVPVLSASVTVLMVFRFFTSL